MACVVVAVVLVRASADIYENTCAFFVTRMTSSSSLHERGIFQCWARDKRHLSSLVFSNVGERERDVHATDAVKETKTSAARIARNTARDITERIQCAEKKFCGYIFKRDIHIQLGNGPLSDKEIRK